MNKFTNPLDNIKIASPCSADWNAMIGNERSRHCGDCKLNVYNLSGMTRFEAENLLLNAEGRVCVRYFKRADGTILTKDCPVGWKALKHRISKKATAFVSVVFATLSGIGITNYLADGKSNNAVMGKIESKFETPKMGEISIEESDLDVENENQAIMGAMIYEPPVLEKTSNSTEIKRQNKKYRH